MSAVCPDIVAKLWNLCNILKDDGVTYHEYITFTPRPLVDSLVTLMQPTLADVVQDPAASTGGVPERRESLRT